MQPGVNDKLTNAEYHADQEYLSSSGLKLILRDIRQYYRKYIEKIPEVMGNQDALDFGTYIHALILEPETIETDFTSFDGRKAGKLWEEFKKLNAHKHIVGNLDVIKGTAIMDAFNANVAAKSMIQNGKAEHTLCTEINGVKVKVRSDYIDDKCRIIDVKTTAGSLKPEAIASTCHKYEYDLSAALYVDVFEKVTGQPHEFYFLFVGKDPIDIQVYKASRQMLENGRRKYKKAIKIIKKCRETGVWFDNDIQEIFMSDYMLFPGDPSEEV